MAFTCAISGQSCSDPVVSPSGRIFERRLILSKLTENGNKDPFQKDRPLTEDQLITLESSIGTDNRSNVTPPSRAPTVSSLLDMLQREHDALLLELFDTRQALEETRRELSQALYQNDAAVRVISRLVMERDGAKAKLASFVPASVEQTVHKVETPVVDEETADVPSEKSNAKISDEDISVMVDTWKKLSKTRKKRSPKYPSFDELSKYCEIDSKANLHKTNGRAQMWG